MICAQNVSEDDRGVMMLADFSVRGALAGADRGFALAAKIYPALGGQCGRPKGVLLSRLWSYTGITGMYFPFTAEANVNIDIPHFMLPATAAHEMAHQRGLCPEDEANFLAYFACSLHPDADFQYSGTMLALLNTMSALYRADPDAYAEVRELYRPGLNRDLGLGRAWRRPMRALERASNKINDSYLRANRQRTGCKVTAGWWTCCWLYRQGKINYTGPKRQV